MKLVQIVPKMDSTKSLKVLLKEKERALRGTSTAFHRQREGRWVHVKHPGWINWDEGIGGVLVAEIGTKVEGAEWQLLQSFIGYLDRHFSKHIESVSIIYH